MTYVLQKHQLSSLPPTAKLWIENTEHEEYLIQILK